MSHVFDPLIKAEDISHEVGVILSESKRNNKWYPGDDELGHHLMMKWRNTRVFNNRQRTGNRSDLKKMSVAKLTQLHKAYFDPRAYVVVGGSFDKKVVFKELNKLKTKRHNLPTKLEQISWVNRGYHEKKFDTISRYLYYMGGIMTESNVMTNFAISFIGELLTNSTHGVLMEWLRNELGWCYDMNFNMECDTDPTIHNIWELCLPLNSKKQVAYVRKELHGRILKAISDKKLVAREVEREKSERLFAFQTLNSIMTEVVSTLGPHGGQIYNEADYLKFLEKCKDTTFLKEIYDKHWAPSVIGEFLAIPK
jgi:predicted Zn-dependent peptidase